MGKRQLRIKKAEIPQKIATYLGTEINLIQENGITLHGRIVQIMGENVLFQDSRRQKHHIAIANIQEIQIDYSAPH
ncbi:MAG: hypothetical protein NZ551_10630 [Microscillaceae bacterium]|nr:hypothetical protein [Microscillaceae bacterium]MDW8461653.1 hypothetical protein [Cytophagales bacterium]